MSARQEANVVYASLNAYYNPNRNGNIDPNRLLRVTDLGTNWTPLVFNAYHYLASFRTYSHYKF